MKSLFDTAYDAVQELVKTFDANKTAYLSPSYSESQARKDFIDKFFIALGWDVNHDIQKNPYEQEVKVEPPVTVGGSQRFADYAFHLGPNFGDVRFYVEAKKPAANLRSAEYYFQVVRYGWNGQTPLAVLTDFQEFHIIDCRFKPDPATALHRAIETFYYSDYSNKEKFARIYWLFSREAVASDSIDKRSAELPRPRGKAVQRGLYPGSYKPVDESFLEDLDTYRTDLAKAFKATDARLNSETLTELTQRTLDRLVFLRFLEDRGIEMQRIVDKFGDRGTVWEDFIAASRRLDAIYNGVVFKPHAILDNPEFNIDDDIFGAICEHLASVNTPYDFNTIPIYILGSIYERFLGKVIVATEKRVRVEDKPEVRKAGGVYYTPEYISRYIVNNTVGRLISEKTPVQISKMRFADISCGSGSFLLSIYDLLLQHYGNYYNSLGHADRKRAARRGDCIEREGKLYLTLRKKREILLENIYGVDIDAQAVEVAQLSLYLRLLREETPVSTHQYQLDFQHVALMKKLLPDLSKNIVCGNSLIGRDILERNLFESIDERKLNPMDFDDAFPEAMNHGGFDAIVGNPPWISLSGKFRNDVYPKTAIDYLTQRYRANTYMPNMYEYFVAQGLTLTREDGFFSFVVPDRLGFNNQFVQLRKRIIDQSRICSLVYKVPFPGITADTLVFVVQKGIADSKHTVSISEYGKEIVAVSQAELAKISGYQYQYFEDAAIMKLVSKIQNANGSVPIGTLCESTSGFGGKSQLITTKRQGKYQIPTIKGDSIGRYELRKIYWFEFKKENITGRTTDICKLGAKEKILLRKTGDHVVATYDDSGIYPEQSLYFLYSNRSQMSLKFILGVINSRLLNFFYRAKSLTNKKSIAQIKKVDLDQLPIRVLNMSAVEEKAYHDKIVMRVDAMLIAKRQLMDTKTDKDRTYYENKCVALERQIDNLVYELFGLEEDEIRMVEVANK